MLRYKDNEGRAIEGDTVRDIVRVMRNMAWTDVRKGVYMDEVAWRINQFDGPSLICSDTPEIFVRTLVDFGFLTPARG